MLSAEQQRLVDAYIASRTWIFVDESLLKRSEDSDWAEGALYDACWETPDVAWTLIREIARSTDRGEILDELANGPLQQLLIEHPEVLPAVESDAAAEAPVRALLEKFWLDQFLPGDLRARIVRALEPRH